MLKVNTKQIEHNTNMLDKYIEKYTENSSEFYNELSKLSSYWIGYEYNNFHTKKLKQMENDIIISEQLNKINDIYKNIENIYKNK